MCREIACLDGRFALHSEKGLEYGARAADVVRLQDKLSSVETSLDVRLKELQDQFSSVEARLDDRPQVAQEAPPNNYAVHEHLCTMSDKLVTIGAHFSCLDARLQEVTVGRQVLQDKLSSAEASLDVRLQELQDRFSSVVASLDVRLHELQEAPPKHYPVHEHIRTMSDKLLSISAHFSCLDSRLQEVTVDRQVVQDKLSSAEASLDVRLQELQARFSSAYANLDVRLHELQEANVADLKTVFVQLKTLVTSLINEATLTAAEQNYHRSR